MGELLGTYGWSDRTLSSRNSQWSAYQEFCAADQRLLVPVTEAHLLGYIGWLANERDAGRRCVSSTSLPQYLSAVRSLHLGLLGTPVPEFPFLRHAIRAYTKWEEDEYPKPDVRMGVSADVVQKICYLGMEDGAAIATIRDAAAITVAFCFNGLRESSVMSLSPANITTLNADVMALKLSIVKGKQASEVQESEYERVDTQSPIDLWLRWRAVRGNMPRWLQLQGESVTWRGTELTAALLRCLQKINFASPPGRKFSSHSMRIGAHTEQVLLGIPIEARMARFGWKPGNIKMPCLYFDRTVKTSAASVWFFGPPLRTALNAHRQSP